MEANTWIFEFETVSIAGAPSAFEIIGTGLNQSPDNILGIQMAKMMKPTLYVKHPRGR